MIVIDEALVDSVPIPPRYDNLVFGNLGGSMRKKYILRRWRQVYNYAWGVAMVKQQTFAIRHKIKLFGRQIIADDIHLLESIVQPSCFLVLPDSNFKLVWTLFMTVVLAYTTIFVPYMTAFMEESTQNSVALSVVNCLVDMVFLVDLGIGFLTAFEREDGLIETRMTAVVKHQLTRWTLLFDLAASFPGDLILALQGGLASKRTTMLRFTRIWAFYRMVRVFKASWQWKVSKQLQSHLGITSSSARLMQSLMIAMYLVHVVSCLWFLSARMLDFGPETWVLRKDMVDSSTRWQYCSAVYWAVQTLSTVGYGDYPARTIPELLLCVVWMFAGVTFYSFLVGSINSHIASATKDTESLAFKLQQLDDFKQQTNFDSQLFYAVKQFLQNNYDEHFRAEDDHFIQHSLPTQYRDEVLKHQLGDIAHQIRFLRACPDAEFVWKLIQLAVKAQWDQDYTIYARGDIAESLFLIGRGAVKMVAPNGVEFMRYGAGEMVGESDSLLGQSRDCKAIAAEDCTLYILRTDQCLPLFREHRTVYESLQKQAYKKRRLHARRMKNMTLPFTEMMDKLSVALRRKIRTKYGINTDKVSQLNKSSFAESAISPSEEDSEVKILKDYVEKHVVNPASADLQKSPSQLSES